MREEKESLVANKGKITCNRSILLSIVNLATKEICGVSRLTSSFKNKLSNILRSFCNIFRLTPHTAPAFASPLPSSTWPRRRARWPSRLRRNSKTSRTVRNWWPQKSETRTSRRQILEWFFGNGATAWFWCSCSLPLTPKTWFCAENSLSRCSRR